MGIEEDKKRDLSKNFIAKQKRVVYLAGGIHGMDWKEAQNGWRDRAISLLEAEGHKTLNPLRNRLWKEAIEQDQFLVNELVDRDLWDIHNADILLVELTKPDRNYIGTITEMKHAKDLNKPRVVFIGDRESYSPWLEYLATKICKTVDEACDYINKYLS